MLFIKGAIFIVFVAFVFAWLSMTGDKDLLGPSVTSVPVLGSPEYDVKSLSAPSASGFFLRGITWLLTKSLIGFPLRRLLLNNNNVQHIRELAAQLPGVEPLYWPIQRSAKVFSEQTILANRNKTNSCQSALRIGMAPEILGTPYDGVFRTTEHYYDAYVSGTLTPLDVTSRFIQAVQSLEHLGAFSSLIKSDILEQAKESTKRWKSGQPLSIFDGVPIAFKDMIQVKGHPTFNGKNPTTERQNLKSKSDGYIAQQFRMHGAIIVGTTTMTEGGVTPLGYAPFFKGPFNPYNISYYSGGSSGGSAVAVASGVVPIAVGFDGGGSIRIPAALSGTYGIATTFGRVTFDRPNTQSSHIKSGVLAASPRDMQLGYCVMAMNPKSNHFYTNLMGMSTTNNLPPAHINFHLKSLQSAKLNRPLSHIKIGIFHDYNNDATPIIVNAYKKALHILEETLGVEIVEIFIPNMHALSLVHGMKISTEFALGFDALYSSSSDKPALESNTRLTCGLGSSMTALEIIAGQRIRRWAFEYMNNLFEKQKIDAIITPTTGILAPKIPADAFDSGEYNPVLVVKLINKIFLANLLGLPAISMPIGYDDSTGLPIGLQLIGNHWEESKILGITSEFSKFTQLQKPPSKNYVDLLLHK